MRMTVDEVAYNRDLPPGAAPRTEPSHPPSPAEEAYQGPDEDAFEPPPPPPASPPEKPPETPLASTPSNEELLAVLQELMALVGAIRGEIGELGDVEFPIAPGGNPAPDDPAARQGLEESARGAADYARGDGPAEGATQPFSETVGAMARAGFSLDDADINALVQWVLREAYIDGTLDLLAYADKVKFFNNQKKAIRKQAAIWRELATRFGGLTDEEKAKTHLDGNKEPGSDKGPDGNPERAADGGEPMVTSAGQRRRDYPNADALVKEFLAYSYNGEVLETPLEDYLTDVDESAQQRLIDAVPYMTSAELNEVLRALGGFDMSLCGELDGFWGRLIRAMRPDQFLDIGAMECVTENWFGGFRAIYHACLKGKTAQIEQSLNVSYGDDRGRLADTYRDRRLQEIAAAKAEADAAEANDGVDQNESVQGDNGPASPGTETGVDVDPSDGSIDDVMLNGAPPPYLIPNGKKISTVAELETAIENLDDLLTSVGEDAQLANVDLQNAVNRQQQLIQMLSNIAKVLHDTAMSTIRKLGQ